MLREYFVILRCPELHMDILKCSDAVFTFGNIKPSHEAEIITKEIILCIYLTTNDIMLKDFLKLGGHSS